jgi:hypothetical protein
MWDFLTQKFQIIEFELIFIGNNKKIKLHLKTYIIIESKINQTLNIKIISNFR